jgi:hypothetical protein
MQVTKDTIKAWVDTPPRSREWLAEMCGGVSPRTVNNWLTSSIEIPAKALRIIENLMRADEAKHTTAPPALSNLVLRIETDEFEDWCRAGVAKNQTVTEYALSAIRDAREAELRIDPTQEKNGTTGP